MLAKGNERAWVKVHILTLDCRTKPASSIKVLELASETMTAMMLGGPDWLDNSDQSSMPWDDTFDFSLMGSNIQFPQLDYIRI